MCVKFNANSLQFQPQRVTDAIITHIDTQYVLYEGCHWAVNVQEMKSNVHNLGLVFKVFHCPSDVVPHYPKPGLV